MKLKPFDRIEMINMLDDPDPIQIGEQGVVSSVVHHGLGKDWWQQVDVVWDNGRSLSLVVPPDQVKKVKGG